MPYAASGVLSFLPTEPTEPVKHLTAQEIYQACHHLFDANALATQKMREVNPEAQMGIMCSFSAIATYAYDCDPENVLGTLNFRRNSWFYSDVMCRGHYPAYVKRIWLENDVHVQMLEGDLELLQSNTADYIAFSYYRSTVFTKKATIREIREEQRD